MNTFWDNLGIKPTVDTGKIRKAYSALVKKHNPEDDEETFRIINQAYKAAMRFAESFSSLDVSDDQIVITDIKENGSFGVKFLNKDGTPMALPPFPGALQVEKEEPSSHQEERASEFDFEDLDTTVVKEYTNDEIQKMSGFIVLAPGISVPEGHMGRKIKRFIDDNDLIKYLGKPADPDDLELSRQDALYSASLIIKDKELVGQTVLWRFFFFSPQVNSLRTDIKFYEDLEKQINDANLHPNTVLSISNASPVHPRSYVFNSKDAKKTVCKIDLVSRVPFRYEPGKYPKFEEIMKGEKPEEVRKLAEFLSKVPTNIYGILMPAFHPVIQESIEDSTFAFKYITGSSDCKDMAGNKLLWKLFFKGTLVAPIIHKQAFHDMITKTTKESKIPKDVLKIIRKQMSSSETVFLVRNKEDKSRYFLRILKKQTPPDVNSKNFKQIEMLSLLLGMAIGILILLYYHYYVLGV